MAKTKKPLPPLELWIVKDYVGDFYLKFSKPKRVDWMKRFLYERETSGFIGTIEPTHVLYPYTRGMEKDSARRLL